MAVTSLPLILAKDAEAVETTQYTAPAGTAAFIDKFTATNTTAGVLSIAVHLVPNGGTAGATNLIENATIPAGKPYTFPAVTGHYLEAGGFISTTASATGLTLRASGREVV